MSRRDRIWHAAYPPHIVVSGTQGGSLAHILEGTAIVLIDPTGDWLYVGVHDGDEWTVRTDAYIGANGPELPPPILAWMHPFCAGHPQPETRLILQRDAAPRAYRRGNDDWRAAAD